MTIDFTNPIVSSRRSIKDDHDQGDDLLLELVCSRNQQAMADLFDRYGGMVYSVALRVLKNPEQAEDVMQEIFFQLWRKPEAFTRERGSLGGWLLVVTRNRAIDFVRRRKPSDSPEDVVLHSKTNLASETERNLLMVKVRDHLNSLPPEQQQTLNMAYFEGLSHTEIAEQTGDPLGTVKSRIRQALIGLRKALVV
jgi:RNA polymerase sigma-70 factor, ECF subfamily